VPVPGKHVPTVTSTPAGGHASAPVHHASPSAAGSGQPNPPAHTPAALLAGRTLQAVPAFARPRNGAIAASTTPRSLAAGLQASAGVAPGSATSSTPASAPGQPAAAGAPAGSSPFSLRNFSKFLAPSAQRDQGLRLGPASGLAAVVILLLIVLAALALALVVADALGFGPRDETWRRVMRRRLLH
jgi:hypothetical protein